MKPDKKACVEAEDPIKHAINVVEKKVRNLEKRRVSFCHKFKQASLVNLRSQRVGPLFTSPSRS